MTAIDTRPSSRLSWVPATAGWIVGTIATLSLLASLSPLLRAVIKVPREFIDNYIFNFPDTSFAWAVVLALLAAALAARKRVAWWILVLNLIFAAGWNVGDLAAGSETRMEQIGEILGLVLHLAAVGILFVSYREFYARVRRGALLRATGVLVAGMTIGTLLGWGLLEMFPRSLPSDERLPYALNRVSGFALADPSLFTGQPGVLLKTLLGLFGAIALVTAAVVLFMSQRAKNALTGEDE
jgi:lysyl-tRNA synthetase class 2